MATKIKDTPPLYGEDARRFIEIANETKPPISEEEKIRIKTNDENFRKLIDRSSSKITAEQYNKLANMCVNYNLLCEGTRYMELCWKILNKILSERINSPIEIVEQVKLFGMTCFNNSKVNHPIDYMYDLFNNLEK